MKTNFDKRKFEQGKSSAGDEGDIIFEDDDEALMLDDEEET